MGHIVETGSTDDVFAPPYHPYTEALLSAVPIADTSVKRKRIILEGDIPSAMNPPSGCPFQTRCSYKEKAGSKICETAVPPIRKLDGGHQIKCHLGEQILARMEPVVALAEEPKKKASPKSKAAPKKKASKKSSSSKASSAKR